MINRSSAPWTMRTLREGAILSIACVVACSSSEHAASTIATARASHRPASLTPSPRPKNPHDRFTADFVQIGSGLSERRMKIAGTNASAWVIRTDITKARVKVIDVVTSVQRKFNYPAYSLAEAYQATNPKAIISGGYSEPATVPQPRGLLVVDEGIISQASRAKNLAAGVFCVLSSGRVLIIDTADPRVQGCKNALQSGPMIVKLTARQGIERKELTEHPYDRSIVGIDAHGFVYFVVTNSVHLYDLANTLRASRREGGLGIVVAIVLGRNKGHAALIYALAQNGNTKIATIGAASVPLPSALAAF